MRLRLLPTLVLVTSSFVVLPSSFAQCSPKPNKAPKPKSATATPSGHQIQPGQFPPAGTEKELAGELIALDHINRAAVLRVDRKDEQKRTQWDRPNPFALLPFATVRYHGAFAELRDIPIGTHLHGGFYEGPRVPQFPAAYVPPLDAEERLSIYLRYNLAARLEDDFSRDQRRGRLWRVDGMDIQNGRLTATGSTADKKADAQAAVFDIGPDARVWKGRGIGTLADIRPGEFVLFNLTLCTMFGAGRITEIWLDDESRAAAAEHQTEVHCRHQRAHGLPGWIEKVDNQAATISVVLFSGMDPKLFDDLARPGWFRAAAAEESLRMWDPVNDAKGGPGSMTLVRPTAPGDSGVRLTFTVGPHHLIEGFRPHRIVRVWPGDGKLIPGWPIQGLPKEERLLEQ